MVRRKRSAETEAPPETQAPAEPIAAVDTVPAAEATSTQEPPYDLHIQVNAAYRDKLKKAVELAYGLNRIPEATLHDLMELFMNWGMNVLKKLWLDRMGYH